MGPFSYHMHLHPVSCSLKTVSVSQAGETSGSVINSVHTITNLKTCAGLQRVIRIWGVRDIKCSDELNKHGGWSNFRKKQHIVIRDTSNESVVKTNRSRTIAPKFLFQPSCLHKLDAFGAQRPILQWPGIWLQPWTKNIQNHMSQSTVPIQQLNQKMPCQATHHTTEGTPSLPS